MVNCVLSQLKRPSAFTISTAKDVEPHVGISYT